MEKVLIFGTFDGVHDGHRAMLRQAKKLAADSLQLTENLNAKKTANCKPQTSSYLVVAVAPDAVVADLKGRPPQHSIAQRIQMLKDERLADEVIPADADTGSWRILKRVKPQIIALGYDQHDLRASLEEFLDAQYPEIENETGEWIKNPKRPTIVTLSAHQPEAMHNSLKRIKH